MNNFSLIIVLSLFLASCSSLASAKQCYFIEDGATTLVFEEKGETGTPQVTLQSPGEEDLVVVGEMQDGVFVYADGTHLNFSEDKAWYSNQPMLDGTEALKIDCN